MASGFVQADERGNPPADVHAYPRTWGAEYVAAGEVRFALWAPGENNVSLRLRTGPQPMARKKTPR